MSDEQNIVYNFSAYLEQISGIPSFVEKQDWGATDLPMWDIRLDSKWDLTNYQDTTMNINMIVTVELIVDIKNTEKALTIMFETFKRINLFDYASGSAIGTEDADDTNTSSAEITPEKTDNNLILRFPYRLKTMVLAST